MYKKSILINNVILKFAIFVSTPDNLNLIIYIITSNFPLKYNVILLSKICLNNSIIYVQHYTVSFLKKILSFID